MMKRRLFVIALLTLPAFVAWAQNGDDILGKWLNPSGEGEVLIYKRGNQYFGKLDWLKFPKDEKGQPKTDKKNPDVSLRSRPEWGLELLKDFTYNGSTYEDGTIYDPKTGKTYSCRMTLNGNKLKIRGYIGISLLGRTEIWTRVK